MNKHEIVEKWNDNYELGDPVHVELETGGFKRETILSIAILWGDKKVPSVKVTGHGIVPLARTEEYEKLS